MNQILGGWARSAACRRSGRRSDWKGVPAPRTVLLCLGIILLSWLAGCSAPPRPKPLPPGDFTPDRVVEAARSLLGSPYRYGGMNKRGFDCSGLTSHLYGSFGIDLPRTAEGQISAGRPVAVADLQPSDLVFFGETRGKLHHVGLVVSNPGEPLRMIHASSSNGVVETVVHGNPYWQPRLRSGRRVID